MEKYGKDVDLFVFLGDDGAFFTNAKIDVKALRNDIAVRCNMQSKAVIREGWGTFC